MRESIFEAILAARSEKRSAVLITDISNGQQCLVIDEHLSGDLKPDDELVKAAKEALTVGVSRLLEYSGVHFFLQIYAAPLRMVVIGGVHIAQALIPMAVLAGYHVVLVDPRQAFANPERFPNVEIKNEWTDKALEQLALDARTAVVALTHDPKVDEPALASALKSEAFYIGALGSTRTAAKRNERLIGLGFTVEELSRIHGPVGFAIGAKSHAEIAVSVMAQITAVLRNATG